VSINEISRPICILGLGLIGGSLLRALAQASQVDSGRDNQHDQGDLVVYGYNRSPSAASTARNDGYDVSNDLIETLQRAEIDKALIVLATPMPAIAVRRLDGRIEMQRRFGYEDYRDSLS